MKFIVKLLGLDANGLINKLVKLLKKFEAFEDKAQVKIDKAQLKVDEWQEDLDRVADYSESVRVTLENMTGKSLLK